MANEGWTRIEVTLTSDVTPEDEALDLMSALLFDLGAQGLETQDAEPPLKVVAAFPPEVDPAGLDAEVARTLADGGISVAALSQRQFEPIDWSTHWRRHFKPLDFGRLWIIPSWLEAPPEAGAVLWIDPSRAFGTGLHATTGLCLERIVELSPVTSVLDVGTGTGILALAALKLGAKRAFGVDNDLDAIDVSGENAKFNGFEGRLGLATTIPADQAYDLVVANILAGPLAEIAPEVVRAVAPGGRLMLSGVLHTQVDDVAPAYEALGMTRRQVFRRDEWVRIEFMRRN